MAEYSKPGYQYQYKLMGRGQKSITTPFPQSYQPYLITHPLTPGPPPQIYPSTDECSVADCLRKVLIVLLVIFMLLVAACFTFWMLVWPSKPNITVEGVSVPRMKASENFLNLTVFANVSVRNPNSRAGIFYEDISAGVLFDGNSLAWNRIPWFFQSKNNSSSLVYSLSAVDAIFPPETLRDLTLARVSGFVPLLGRINSLVRFKMGSWTSRFYPMAVYCEFPVHFHGADQAGRLAYPGEDSKQCEVVF